MHEFVLPYPPSCNRYYRNVGGRTLLSRAGRLYREEVAALLAGRGCLPTAAQSLRRPLAGPIQLEIDIHPPDRRRRDIDNVLKGLLDSIEKGGGYHDDSQIVHLTIRKREPVAKGRAIVRMKELQSE